MNSRQIRRIGGIIGASGCSVALLYATFGVMYRNLSADVESQDKHSRGSALGDKNVPGDETSQPESSTETRDYFKKERKRSVGRRAMDAIERRRAQERFPWNGWWHLGRYRPDKSVRDGGSTARSQTGHETSMHYSSSRQVAAMYPDVVEDIRILAQGILGSGTPLLPRFDDIELARYAIHYGILRIKSNNDSTKEKAMQMVVQDAAEGVVDSQHWFQSHEFAPIQDMYATKYSQLIWWEYSKHKDDRPILHVDIGKAVECCRSKKMQLEFANIVLTMMELASLNSPLTGIESPPGGIDRIDVRIYAEGTNTMNATRTFWILRAVVKSVSHHYPGRLNTLVLYDLPTVLNWIILGVKKLVHPETARKLSVYKR